MGNDPSNAADRPARRSGFWKHGYDFIMEIGTTVIAARSGVVGWANDGCTDGDMSCTNLITIVHDDGQVSLYSHLTLGGVLVEPGQTVSKGDTIGLSGNTDIPPSRTSTSRSTRATSSPAFRAPVSVPACRSRSGTRTRIPTASAPDVSMRRGERPMRAVVQTRYGSIGGAPPGPVTRPGSTRGAITPHRHSNLDHAP